MIVDVSIVVECWINIDYYEKKHDNCQTPNMGNINQEIEKKSTQYLQ